MLREPTLSVTSHCVIPCGIGLGILSLEEIFTAGISKPEIDIDKFTEFGVGIGIDSENFEII